MPPHKSTTGAANKLLVRSRAQEDSVTESTVREETSEVQTSGSTSPMPSSLTPDLEAASTIEYGWKMNTSSGYVSSSGGENTDYDDEISVEEETAMDAVMAKMLVDVGVIDDTTEIRLTTDTTATTGTSEALQFQKAIPFSDDEFELEPEYSDKRDDIYGQELMSKATSDGQVPETAFSRGAFMTTKASTAKLEDFDASIGLPVVPDHPTAVAERVAPPPAPAQAATSDGLTPLAEAQLLPVESLGDGSNVFRPDGRAISFQQKYERKLHFWYIFVVLHVILPLIAVVSIIVHRQNRALSEQTKLPAATLAPTSAPTLPTSVVCQQALIEMKKCVANVNSFCSNCLKQATSSLPGNTVAQCTQLNPAICAGLNRRLGADSKTPSRKRIRHEAATEGLN